MDFLTNFKHIIQDINNEITAKYPTINQGGCGAYALYMGQMLKEFGFDIKFCLLSNKYKTREIIIPNKYDYNIFKKIPFGHIILCYNNVYFDAKRWSKHPYNISPHFSYLLPGYINQDVLHDMVEDVQFWNTTFNHNNRLDVANIINQIVNDYYWN